MFLHMSLSNTNNSIKSLDLTLTGTTTPSQSRAELMAMKR